MEPVSAVGLACNALQLGASIAKTVQALCILRHDAQRFNDDIDGLISESQSLHDMCELVNHRITAVLGPNHRPALAHEQRPTSVNLLSYLKTHLNGCKDTAARLQSAVEQVGGSATNSWQEISGAIKLSLRAKDLAAVKDQIRSHTTGLHTVLLTLSFEASRSVGDAVTINSEQLHRILHELKAVRNDFKTLRARRSEHDDEERALSLNDDNILQASGRVIATGESLCAASCHIATIQNQDRRVLTWINGIGEDLDNPVRESSTAPPRQASRTQSIPTSPETTDPTSLAAHEHGTMQYDILKPAESGIKLELLKTVLADGELAFHEGDYDFAQSNLKKAQLLIHQVPPQPSDVYDRCDIDYMLAVCMYKTDSENAEQNERTLLGIIEQISVAHHVTDAKRQLYVCTANHLLAEVYLRLGSFDDALSKCEAAVDGRSRLKGVDSDERHESIALMVRIYVAQGDPILARTCLNKLPTDRREKMNQGNTFLHFEVSEQDASASVSNLPIIASAPPGSSVSGATRIVGSLERTATSSALDFPTAGSSISRESGVLAPRTLSRIAGQTTAPAVECSNGTTACSLPLDDSGIDGISPRASESTIPQRGNSLFHHFHTNSGYIPPQPPDERRRLHWAIHFKLSTKSNIAQALLEDNAREAQELIASSRKRFNLVKSKTLSDGLRMAALFGQNEIVAAFLKQGVKASADKNQPSALHCAAFGGCKHTVDILLKHKAPVDLVNPDFGTPLCLAAIAGRLDVIEILLDHGADVILDGGPFGSAVHAACAADDGRLVEALAGGVSGLGFYRDVKPEVVQKIRSILEQPGERESSFQMPLIADGMKIASEDRCRLESLRCPPLAMAAYFGCSSIISHFVRLRAEGMFKTCTVGCQADKRIPPLVYNKGDHTVLTLAAVSGNRHILEILLDYGIQTRNVSQGDEDALWFATLNERTDCAVFLIQRGAPSNRKIEKFAKITGQDELLRAIEDRRGRQSVSLSEGSTAVAS